MNDKYLDDNSYADMPYSKSGFPSSKLGLSSLFQIIPRPNANNANPAYLMANHLYLSKTKGI